MRTNTQRFIAIAAVGFASLLVTQCGGGGSVAGTSPSPSTSPSPGGSTAPPSSGGSAGSALSLNPSSIQGQGQPQATVTLPSAAPDGGALVVVTSSNPGVAKAPSTVTVAAGSRSASFLIDTATVLSPVSVTISASYAGATMFSTLTVTPPPLSATFVARSRTRGLGACAMEENTQELDCLLDGAGSSGFIDAWVWTYNTATSQLGHTSKDAASHPQISTKCAFLQTATGGDGPNGDRFLNMEVTLQVQDRAGARSEIVRQPVRLYPNRQCGFSY
jgi:hypothetical protein